MTTDRRAANKAKLRAEILEAARAILVRDGDENFSMRLLAHHIGYTPAAVYKHFESKGEIFSQLADASFAALIESSNGSGANLTMSGNWLSVHDLKRFAN